MKNSHTELSTPLQVIRYLTITLTIVLTYILM
jgi:hypothetical protein